MTLFDQTDRVAMSPTQLHLRDDLNTRISSGQITLEDVPCLCGASVRQMERLSDCDRYGIMQPVVICRRCGLIQLNPRMNETVYKWFYTSDYYRHFYEENDRFQAQYEAMMTPQQGERILWSVQRSDVCLDSVVEIGAGAGWNLLAFKQAGAEVVGWDYSPQLTELGMIHGIRMQQGGIRDALAEGTRYDVIILNHVCEHLLDPVAQLRDLHALLNPGGRLYLGVPATDYPEMSLLQTAHTYYFSDRTLRHYLAQAGWVAGEIVHENHVAMHTVAFSGQATPVSLATEYYDSLRRLHANKSHVRCLKRWQEARVAVGRVMARLGIYTTVRTFYRRLAG